MIIDKITLLSKVKNSCAVIGNGPFETNLSKVIDNAFVLRCNYFDLNFEGIGKRTDINISSLYHEVIPNRKVDYPIFGVYPFNPYLFQRYTNLQRMHIDWQKSRDRLIQMKNQVWTYSNNDSFSLIFSEVCESIEAIPTVGLMGIAIARWLQFKTIILTGFTFFKTKKTHYYDDKMITIESYHHKPESERKLIKKWISCDKATNYIIDNLLFFYLKD